ncbi:MAG: hypothetical protein M3N09_06670 [Actinomycetota bacterium]|nr:hypothetical protein [Actinomycetota bacterium]
MTERERQIEYLMEWPICIDRAEAERRARDLDLWLVEPDLRPDLQGEEAVREWEGAVAFITAMTEGFAYTGDGVINNATSQLLYDAQRRAEEALRRARERAEA